LNSLLKISSIPFSRSTSAAEVVFVWRKKRGGTAGAEETPVFTAFFPDCASIFMLSLGTR
jgi:hypothetical protein